MMKKRIAILFCFFPCSLFPQYIIDTNTLTNVSRLFDLSFNNAEKNLMLDGLKDNIMRR